MGIFMVRFYFISNLRSDIGEEAIHLLAIYWHFSVQICVR